MYWAGVLGTSVQAFRYGQHGCVSCAKLGLGPKVCCEVSLGFLVSVRGKNN